MSPVGCANSVCEKEALAVDDGGAVVLSILHVAFQRLLQLVFLLFRSTEFKELKLSSCATRHSTSAGPRRTAFAELSQNP